MKTQTGSLQLHVGFLLEENVGFSCDFGLAEEQIVVADDLELDDTESLDSSGRMR